MFNVQNPYFSGTCFVKYILMYLAKQGGAVLDKYKPRNEGVAIGA